MAHMFYYKEGTKSIETPMGRAHKNLSVKQELALELMLCGMNDGEIAKRAIEPADRQHMAQPRRAFPYITPAAVQPCPAWKIKLRLSTVRCIG